MVNFDRLTAEIRWQVWGTPANFNGFRVLAALMHGTLVVGVSQTLRRWTQGATYIRQGGHHVGHWPTFWFSVLSIFLSCAQLASADHVQAFVIAESVSDITKHRNCVPRLSAWWYPMPPASGILKVGRVKGDLISSVGQKGSAYEHTAYSYCAALTSPTQSNNLRLLRLAKWQFAYAISL